LLCIGIVVIIVVAIIPVGDIIVVAVGVNPPLHPASDNCAVLERSSLQSMSQGPKDLARGDCAGLEGSHLQSML